MIVEPVAANMGLVPPRRGFLDGPAPPLHRRRRAARLRRGDHRVPPRARRRAGPLRRHSRPLDVRQGDRRRAPARRARRPGRGHGPARARSAPCTRPAPCRGTRSPPPPGSRCSHELDDAAYAELERQGHALRRRPRAGRSPRRPGHAGRRRSTGIFFADRAGHELRPGAGRRPRALRRVSSTTCSTRGVFLAPSGYETLFVQPRPHRRAHRPDGRDRRRLRLRRSGAVPEGGTAERSRPIRTETKRSRAGGRDGGAESTNQD